jgi:hypothetical protein
MVLNKKSISGKLRGILRKRVEESSSKKSRIIVEKKIVDRMFSDIEGGKISRLELWFQLKPYWWFRDVKYWFRRKRQKWTTGFPHEESWDFKSALASWALPRLKYMKDNLHGYPSRLIPEEKWEEISAGKEIVDEGRNIREEHGMKEWIKILDKIIWSFENHDNEPSPTEPENYDSRCNMIKYDDGSTEYEHLDDRPWDWTECEAHDKKVQEGLDLFAKHYKDLWS